MHSSAKISSLVAASLTVMLTAAMRISDLLLQLLRCYSLLVLAGLSDSEVLLLIMLPCKIP